MDGCTVIDTVRNALMVTPDGRVTRADAATKIFGRSSKTMCEWAAKGWGPRPIYSGSRVFYDVDECLAMARGEKPIAPRAA